MDAHSGDRLGPYLLREQLGEGGMGVVYLASDPDGSPVAVKVLRQGVPAEATARHRLAREVATMGRVHSPFVAEVVDADIEGSRPYIVTRYVAGRTLDDVVAADGPLTGAALASLARGLAAALVAVHAAGVVHRDLKPGNVMLVDGKPVVIDFGIAQALDSTRLTMTGMFMGTPGYLAPEVIEGNTSGPAADVHSWATTVAYAATGRPPYGTGQFEAIFYRIVHGQPELDRMPAPLLPIVLAALARDPSRRPSAAELAVFAAGLTPETLLPAPAGAAANAIPAGYNDPAQALSAGQATSTALDIASQQPAAALSAWPGTRPIGARPQDDFADLLTPVRYSAAPARPGQLTGTPTVPPGSMPPWSAPAPGSALQGPGGRGQLPGGQAPPAGREPGARSASQAARLPLVLATLAALVAISVLLPIAGAAAALGVLVLLHATDATSAWLSRRRSRQGPRSSDPVSVTAFYPWAVCRAVLSFLLRAPLALLCAAVAAVLAVLAGGQAELPRAGGYAAGAIVACYCIGPGSRACRRPLSTFYGRIARSAPAAAIGSLGLAAMVAGVVVAAATMTPGYWPDWHLGNQLQAATTAHPTLNNLSGNVNVTDLGRQLAHWLGRL
jgi:predicted Ser/Thr protein kinase